MTLITTESLIPFWQTIKIGLSAPLRLIHLGIMYVMGNIPDSHEFEMSGALIGILVRNTVNQAIFEGALVWDPKAEDDDMFLVADQIRLTKIATMSRASMSAADRTLIARSQTCIGVDTWLKIYSMAWKDCCAVTHTKLLEEYGTSYLGNKGEN